jgi:hypothetical protein
MIYITTYIKSKTNLENEELVATYRNRLWLGGNIYSEKPFKKIFETKKDPYLIP